MHTTDESCYFHPDIYRATQEHVEEKVSATDLEPYTGLFERHKGDLRAMFDDLGEDPGYVHRLDSRTSYRAMKLLCFALG